MSCELGAQKAVMVLSDGQAAGGVWAEPREASFTRGGCRAASEAGTPGRRAGARRAGAGVLYALDDKGISCFSALPGAWRRVVLQVGAQ